MAKYLRECPLSVDYTRLSEVVAFAQRLADVCKVEQLVVHYPGRPNYNVTFPNNLRPSGIVVRRIIPNLGIQELI